MSGIVGLFARGRGRNRDSERRPGQGHTANTDAQLTAMYDRIAHRGPDGGGTWCDDQVGVGHQRLETTPESQYDTQPTDQDGLVVVSDARLDNREELLETLPISQSGTPIPDSEVLSAAYRQWGTQCVDHLIGAFAFAVWDRARERLFCARDHIGVKPLYYHRSEDVFAFASEQKSLLTLPSVSVDLDETKIGDFLTGLFEDTENTFYESIRRLPPAHAMTVSADDSHTWQYWDLDPTRTITLESDEAYERRFRDLFEQAVECRMRTNGTLGSALSGGLDSSSITVMVRELLSSGEALQTFSNVFDDAPSSDEREFIETVIDREGITPQYLFMDDFGSLVDLESVLDHYDQPPHNTMHFSRWLKAKRVREAGVDVVFCGALGDSAVDYGLGMLPQLLRTGRWPHLYRELSSMGEIVDAPTTHLFVRHALKPMIPESILRRRKRYRGQPVLVTEANPTLDRAFVDRIGLDARYETLTSSDSVFTLTARRWQYNSLMAGLSTATLETSDVANAAFGLEQRYPFTDIRLLEFSLAIPPTQQLKDGWTRSIIRRSLDDVLPEKIQWRPWKTMMNEGFWNALEKEDEQLQAILADPGPLAEYVDLEALQASYDRFTDEPNSRDARSLWRALSLSVWLSEHGSADRDRSINLANPEQKYQLP